MVVATQSSRELKRVDIIGRDLVQMGSKYSMHPQSLGIILSCSFVLKTHLWIGSLTKPMKRVRKKKDFTIRSNQHLIQFLVRKVYEYQDFKTKDGIWVRD